jgi:TPR repeat protein
VLPVRLRIVACFLFVALAAAPAACGGAPVATATTHVTAARPTCAGEALGCQALVDTLLHDPAKAPALAAKLARACKSSTSAAAATDAAARDVCYADAWFLADGAGVTHDPKAALARFRSACAAAHLPSCGALAELTFEGLGGPADPAAAQRMWRDACDKGDLRACADHAQSWKRLGRTLLPDDAVVRLDKACTGGEPLACARLGAVYANERGGEDDELRGQTLARRSCDAGSAEGCFTWAQIVVADQRVPWKRDEVMDAMIRACRGGVPMGCTNAAEVYPAAMPRLEAMCQGGLLDACSVLGEEKLLRAKDTSVLALFERGCARGQASDCMWLAAAAGDGVGRTADAKAALELDRRACSLGSAGGCYRLSAAYYTGEGVTQDDAQGDRVLDESCARGVAESCVYLASVREQDGDKRMIAAYERACAAGSPGGCTRAAELHHAVHHAADAALPFEIRACLLRDAGSCARVGALGWEHQAGIDDDEGVHAAARGCKLGSVEACFVTARFLGAGRGVPLDVEHSRSMMAKACAANWGPACAEAAFSDHFRRIGTSVEHAALAQHACELGAARGCTFYAWLNLAGDGVALDEGTAVEIFKHACALGDDGACGPARLFTRLGLGTSGRRDTSHQVVPPTSTRGAFAKQSGSCEPAAWADVAGGSTILQWSAPGLFSAASATVSPFRIRTTAVTQCQYLACVKARKCTPPDVKNMATTDVAMAPVTGVSFAQAEAYCRFEGGRLPHEAEWAFAGQGEGHAAYPWGVNEPPCGTRGVACPADDGHVGARSFDVSAAGVHDLTTRVSEWTGDWFGAWTQDARDPTGPASGKSRVVRGGTLDALVTRLPRHATDVAPDLGFRCVLPAR